MDFAGFFERSKNVRYEQPQNSFNVVQKVEIFNLFSKIWDFKVTRNSMNLFWLIIPTKNLPTDLENEKKVALSQMAAFA